MLRRRTKASYEEEAMRKQVAIEEKAIAVLLHEYPEYKAAYDYGYTNKDLLRIAYEKGIRHDIDRTKASGYKLDYFILMRELGAYEYAIDFGVMSEKEYAANIPYSFSYPITSTILTASNEPKLFHLREQP